MIIEINRKHLCKNVKQTFISTWIVMPVKKNLFHKSLRYFRNTYNNQVLISKYKFTITNYFISVHQSYRKGIYYSSRFTD